EEWLLDDFDFDQAMASELAKSFGLGEAAAGPGGIDFASGSGGLGLDQIVKLGEGEVAAEEKGGPPGLLDAPRGVLLEVKKEAVMLLGGGLGGELGPGQAPVLGIGDFVAEGDSLEAAIDADMCTVAAGDADASTVAAVHATASTVAAEMNTVAADNSTMSAVDADASVVAAVHAETSTGASVDAEMSAVGAVDADTSTVAAVDADTSTIASVDAEMSSGTMIN
uniref:Uncharacterized protein n=1 Tax=Aegilops tauschii subsp. strangulata TaxID=200361 RepID=A0A452ZH38_AEGTS